MKLTVIIDVPDMPETKDAKRKLNNILAECHTDIHNFIKTMPGNTAYSDRKDFGLHYSLEINID